jgi:integrase
MRKPEIVVSVITRHDRKHLSYRWKDHVGGTSGEETAGTPNRRDADRGVPAFIEELLSRRTSTVSWEEFRKRYENEKVAGLRPKTQKNYRNALNQFENVIEPQHLSDLDDSNISRFRAHYRGLAEETSVDSYLRQIRPAARWAARIFKGYEVPEFKLRQGSKGRPLLQEEWDRLIEAVPKVVGEQHADSWVFFLEGLVSTGLRLGQALNLRWEIDAPIHLENLDGRCPLLVIAVEEHKGKREQEIPLTREAKTLFRTTSPREGYVFRLGGRNGGPRSPETVSAKVCEIGKKAGIKTGTRISHAKKTKGKRVPRFAGAHDIKRTYVQRLLALGLSPPEVAVFAQHASFETTWKHYTEKDARRLASRLESLYEKNEGDKRVTPPVEAPGPHGTQS